MRGIRPTVPTVLAILAAAILVLPALGVAPLAQDGATRAVAASSAAADDGPDGEGHSANATTVTSFDGTEIAITVFRPAGASASAPVPILLHSHGWSGSRWDPGEVDGSAAPYLDAGFCVVSIDQRGHGDSGGQAQAMDPAHEARDVMAVIDHVAGLDWVLLDDAGEPGADDPRLGALGGSYGGAYQLITALEETRTRPDGQTRFDALAPEITWFNIAEGLGPNTVPRSVWIDLLYGAAKATGTDVAPWIDEGYAEYMATGEPPAWAFQRFYEHSPEWYVDRGVHLDVPALFLQGLPDTLLPLDHALDNFHRTLTPTARQGSILVGHLGGHVLNTEGTLPGPGGPGVGLQPPAEGDPCSDAIAGGQTELVLAWYRHHLLDRPASDLPFGEERWALDAGTCWPADGGAAPVTVTRHDAPPATPQGTPVAAAPAGPVQYLPLADGPRTVGGDRPVLEMTVVPGGPPGVEARVFFALAAGTGPGDARVLDSQWTPLRVGGGNAAYDETVDLVPVTGHVAEGETLFLAVATWVDQFGHDANRVPASAILQDVAVEVPTV